MLLAFVLATAPVALVLSLTCSGRSFISVPVETAAVTARDSYGGSASGSGVRTEIREVEASVGFRLEQGLAKMQLPAMFLPNIHGGRGGWFNVKNLAVTEREITGKVAVNFLHQPSFRIDRMTGEITSSGGFHGQCERESSEQRKF